MAASEFTSSDDGGLVARLLADPPRVHALWNAEGKPVGLGLGCTEAECYQFIASRCRAGDRTLETGLGLSTALFGELGTKHTCVTWTEDEVDRLQTYCTERGITTASIEFHVGLSEQVLPALPPSELDLVFIDGSHGFPTPIIDWFYAGGRLRKGGILVVDDCQLPAVRVLADYLDSDPRWKSLRDTDKWLGYERLSEGMVAEDWWAQWAFFGPNTKEQRRSILSALGQRVVQTTRKYAARAARRQGP